MGTLGPGTAATITVTVEAVASGTATNVVSVSGTGSTTGESDAESDTAITTIGEVQDTDNDSIPDNEDNCPEVANPNQEDANGNEVGDACEAPPDVDADNDGVPDERDNCPANYNPFQTSVMRMGWVTPAIRKSTAMVLSPP